MEFRQLGGRGRAVHKPLAFDTHGDRGTRMTRKVFGGFDGQPLEPYRFSGPLGSRPNGGRGGIRRIRWLSMMEIAARLPVIQ